MVSRLLRRWSGLRLWGAGSAALWVVMLALVTLRPASALAQSVTLDGPTGPALSTITPTLQLRTFGLESQLPLQVTLQVATSPDFGALVVDSVFSLSDTRVDILVTRPLPSEAQVWWRARVRTASGLLLESNTTGPRAVPAWLTLIAPNSPTGNSFDIRRPQFVWRSAPIAASVGPWTYDIEVTTNNRPELGAAGIRDTTFRPTTDLQANTSYRWSLRAWLRGGESIRVSSLGSFVITDPPLPTTTLLFQNFPNPFPSATSFATCFWFDVGAPGARIRLDVLDLRGNQVKTIVPGFDGQTQFEAGRYGRGAPGSSSNCDNRFVWDGTATDGRTVAPGVYIARFVADNGKPSFRRIVFRGR